MSRGPLRPGTALALPLHWLQQPPNGPSHCVVAFAVASRRGDAMRSMNAFIAVPAFMACVSQAKFEDTSKQLDAAKLANDNRQRRIASLEATVAAERAELRRRQAEMERAVQELSSLGQAHGQSRAEVVQLREAQDDLNQQLASV